MLNIDELKEKYDRLSMLKSLNITVGTTIASLAGTIFLFIINPSCSFVEKVLLALPICSACAFSVVAVNNIICKEMDNIQKTIKNIKNKKEINKLKEKTIINDLNLSNSMIKNDKNTNRIIANDIASLEALKNTFTNDKEEKEPQKTYNNWR